MKVTIPNKVKPKPLQVQCSLLFIFTQAPVTCCVAQFSLKLMTTLSQSPSAEMNTCMSYHSPLVDFPQSPCVIHRTHQQAEPSPKFQARTSKSRATSPTASDLGQVTVLTRWLWAQVTHPGQIAARMVKAPALLCLVPLGRACQKWCFFYIMLKILSSVILCFPWQPTEHTSDVAGNQRGPWS